ncbi:hypothetical protein J2T10_001968 [Paenarthrobacter nicotinovorans]|uniref:Uncharacterized protein n=1 Tax=Paenarthrobacter nicotinovorans TaxID=29320 RepID=A0ABT9TL03_PAENI|nr:hypothetical protein [Paenarthrobacter nicotinovorans]MDQ0102322.1 hypothetical protein [Paenarthrobacter nicotinovorans]
MTESLAPKSDQLDAVDLVGGPRTFRIERVTKNNAEQPFNFHLEGFPRVWRPGLSMRRVIVKAWGGKTSAYVGQSVTLYCDPSVEFGGSQVGGTRISHMSGIEKPLKVPLLIKRGKSAMFTVQPLKNVPAPAAEPQTEPWRAQWQAITNALTTAGYEGDGPAMLATAGQVIGTTWEHPNKISPEDAQKILAAVREDNHQEPTE